MTRFASALIVFFLTPATANAFQFDSWRSGMSVREAMAVAQDKDIPIVKDGIISVINCCKSNGYFVVTGVVSSYGEESK